MIPIALAPGDCGMVPTGVWWRSRGHGPAVVLLNGYGASADLWPSGWLTALARRFRVVTPDVRGGGWSRFAEAPFTIRDLAQDVVAVLDDAGIDRAVLLGLSMGGMIAQEVALVAPHRVEGLVLAGTRPPAPAFVHPPWTSSMAFVRGPRSGESLAAFQRRLWSASVAPGFPDRRPDLLDEVVAQSVARPTPRSGLVQQLRAMTAWSGADRLGSLAVPTAVVHGRLDRFAVPDNGRSIAAAIPGATLTLLDDTGHLLPLEAQDALDRAIDEVRSRAAA